MPWSSWSTQGITKTVPGHRYMQEVGGVLCAGFLVIILLHVVVRQLQQWSLVTCPVHTNGFVWSDEGQKPMETGQALWGSSI